MRQPDFLEKSRSGKNDQKLLKMAQKLLYFFKKSLLVLPGFCVEWKFLWFINILRNLHVWKKSGSQVHSHKRLSGNEISVFFSRQYFTNRLISDFDFWHVDRHESKKQSSLIGFLKKLSFGEMGHFGPKNCASS